jgi:signal transduction histidine kinase/CheY-like chemotaxis protein
VGIFKLAGAILALVVLSLVSAAVGAAPTTIDIHTTLGARTITTQAAILEDPTGRMTIEEASSATAAGRFEPTPESITLGYTRSAFWLRLSTDNRSAAEMKWLLLVDYAPLDSVQLYDQKADGSWRMREIGDTVPFARREIRYRSPVFPVVQAPGPATYFLRVRTTSPVNLPLSISSPKAFERMRERQMPLLLSYFGLLAGMILFNLLLLLTVRDPSYLYYVLYVSSMTLFLFTHNGLSHQLLWPAATTWSSQGLMVIGGSALLFATQFARSFLDTRKHMPRMDRLLRLYIAIAFVTMCISAIGPYGSLYKFASVMTIVTIATLLAVAVTMWRRGVEEARLYVVASATVLAGIATGLMKALGLLPSNFLTAWGYQIALALEAILLSTALAHRINLMRSAVGAMNLDLESRVDERTEELATANEQLREEIDERLATEAQRQAMERQFQQSQKMEALGRLAGGVAHDMNNVLSAIMTMASLVAKRMRPDDAQRDNVEEILDTAKRGADLTTNLLGFARQGKYEKRRISLADAIDKVEQLLARTASKKIDLQMACGGGAFVEGDSNQLHHALMNLCLNAIDAMDDEGVLTVDCQVVELDGEEIAGLQAGRYVRLQVRDTGRGMSEEVAGRAFDPFFTTKEQGEGTGLGLAMVYGTAENHGGTVTLASIIGEGSTATMYLPAVEPPSLAPAASERVSLLPTGTGTILVVDDEIHIRRAARRSLQDLGYDVLLANNGREALEIYREHQADIVLVILDMLMPEMDGAETFELLQERGLEAPVLLSSGYSMQEIPAELLEQGAAGYLAKPYDMSALAKAIAAAL